VSIGEQILSHSRDMSTHKRVDYSGIVPNMGLPLDKLLAANLGRIFEARGITSAKKAEEQLKVPRSTVDRAWNCRSMARLDTLQDVAAGLKVQPWQLLVPGLDPHNLPQLEGAASPQKVAESSADYVSGQDSEKLDADELVRLISGYALSTKEARARIQRMIRSEEKIASSPVIRAVPHDK
jgi:hypothetical protein